MSMTVKLGMWTLALVPFATAVVIHSGAAPTPMSMSLPTRPALAFRQYAVDLGPISPTGEARGTFVFNNRGGQPVEIQKIVPSCSCLVPRVHRQDTGSRRMAENDAVGFDQQPFAPGETGRIVLRVQPANESSGPKELFADVYYADPEPRQVRLTFKLQIPERQMTVNPPALIVFHPEGSSPTVSTLTVTDGRKRPFEILGVEATSELVTTTIGERALAKTGEWSQSLQVTIPGEIPAGRHQILLRIMTSDADFPELRVPVQLMGPSAEGDAHHDHEHGPRPPLALQPAAKKS